MKNLRINVLFTALLLLSLVLPAYAQPSSLNPEETANQAIIERYFEEVINEQKTELVPEIYAEDYLFHSLEDGTEGRGIEGLEEFLPYFFQALPDIHYTIDRMVTEGNQVVVQATARGTHRGEFWGYPPSNNKIQVSEVFFYTLKDGKITENRRLIDL